MNGSAVLDTNNDSWICWQCGIKFLSATDLSHHFSECAESLLKLSSPMEEDYKPLVGCPFCPGLDDIQKKEPFNLMEFNDHVLTVHFEVEALKCPYCCKQITPMDISLLTSHIMIEHCIHWRPSPHSLSFMRQDVLVQREINCLGCGGSFYTIGEDLATPSLDLIEHLSTCNGSVVALEPLSESKMKNGVFPKPILRALNLRAKSTSWDFAERYPFSRGFMNRPKNLQTKLEEIDKYNAEQDRNPIIMKQPPLAAIRNPSLKYKRNISVKCDVSLALPPSPPVAKRKKISAIGRVYVCPVCGDNSLSSLRERDEHLQYSHNGECVFACQICGRAYPLYIALRRHAAKDHREDYDGCLYGIGNTESDEVPQTFDCLKCNLVSFTKNSVLKKHMRVMHNEELVDDRIIKNSGLIRCRARLKSENSGDEDGEISAGEVATSPGKIRARGRPPGTRNKRGSCDEDDKEGNKGSKGSNGQFYASELELKMKLVSPEEKTCFCHDCQRQFHNQRELLLHIEIEHSESECNQLGCQACGRIFFGPDQKMDLIGHLRIVHNNVTTDNAGNPTNGNLLHAVMCSNSECEAVFYSARLRQLHSCPMRSILERCHNLLNIPDEVDGSVQGTIDMLSLPDELNYSCDPRVLATEIGADDAGTFVLAYGCPNCDYIFTGVDSTERYLEHRREAKCGRHS